MGLIQQHSIKGTLATYSGMAIGYVNLILLYPHFLTPEQLGLTRVLIAVGMILAQFALLGTPYTLVRYFPFVRNHERKHHGFFRFLLGTALFGFVVVSGLALVFRHQIEVIYAQHSPLFNTYFYWIFPLALFMALTELFFNHCRSLLKTPIPLVFKEVVLRLLQMLAIGCWIGGWVSFTGFICLFVSSYLVVALLHVGYLIHMNDFFYGARIDFQHLVSTRQLWRFSLFMFASGSAATYVAFIDTVMLSAMENLEATAIYSIAFLIGTIIHIPARTMNMIAIAVVAEAWKKEDLTQINRLYRKTALNQLIIGGGLLILIWANVTFLLDFLPPVYSQARWIILIIGLGRLVDMAAGMNGEILAASRHVKVNLLTQILLIILVTWAHYLLIPRLGMTGAALATSLSLLAYNGIRSGFLWWRYRLHPFSRQWVVVLGLVLLAFAVAEWLPDVQNRWIGLLYKTTTLVALFGGTIWYFHLSPELDNVLNVARQVVAKLDGNKRK